MAPSSSGSTPPPDSGSTEADAIEFEFEHLEEEVTGRVSEAKEPRKTAGSKPAEQRESGEAHAAPPSAPFRGDRRWPGALAWLLLLPCLAGLIWLMLPVVFRIEAGLKYPYQLDAEEGFVYKQGIDLSQGRSIYPPIDREPYLVGNYPPVYPGLIALTLMAGGEGLAAARSVVAASAALIALLLIALAYAVCRNGAAALLAPLLFLVSYEFYTWSPYARVDLPALALTLMGALAFVQSRTRPGLVFSAVCFVAAAYTRQTAILAPAAGVVALVATDRRHLAWFLAPYLALGLGLFVILNLLSNGELWNHLVVYNRNEMDWNVLRSILVNEIWFFYRWWMIGLALAAVPAIVGAFLQSRRRTVEAAEAKEGDRIRRRAIFVPTYFVLSALSLAAFAKSGSAANYALEPLAAASLFFAFVFGRSLEQAREGSGPVRFAGVVGMVLFAFMLWAHVARMLPVDWRETLPDEGRLQRAGEWMNGRRVAGALFSSRNPDAAEITRGDRVVAMLGSARGDVLSELPIFTLAAGKDVLFQPFIMSTLAREGRWDSGPFLEDLRERRFDLILTTQDLRAVREGGVLARYTEAMAETLLDHYALEAVMPPGSLGTAYYLWRPRDRAQS